MEEVGAEHIDEAREACRGCACHPSMVLSGLDMTVSESSERDGEVLFYQP